MKTTKQQSTGRIFKVAFALILTAGLAGSTFANTSEPEKEIKKTDKAVIEALTSNFDTNYILPGQERVSYKIYDNQDNLIHEATMTKNEVSKDEKLSKLLHKADLVMNMNGTKYFKVN